MALVKHNVYFMYAFVIVIVRSVLSQNRYCDTPAARVCQTDSINHADTVYLDTTGAPLYQTSSCRCTLEVTLTGSKPTYVTVMPMLKDPGSISLAVNGVLIHMKQHVLTQLEYSSPMVVHYIKSSDDYIRQCFEFRGAPDIDRISLLCKSGWPSTSSTQTLSLTTTTTTTTTQTKTVSDTAVAVYGVAPIVGVLIVVAVVGGLFFWRRRQKSHGRSTKRSNYVNTENLDETTVPNAERGHPYENEFNRHFNSNEHNYEGLDPQRERATNEHMYSGIEPERDLTNTTNNGSLTEDEHESTPHVYGNDYMSLETQREREHTTKEHSYSGLQSQCDFANIAYENTDGAYENRMVKIGRSISMRTNRLRNIKH